MVYKQLVQNPRILQVNFLSPRLITFLLSDPSTVLFLIKVKIAKYYFFPDEFAPNKPVIFDSFISPVSSQDLKVFYMEVIDHDNLLFLISK